MKLDVPQKPPAAFFYTNGSKPKYKIESINGKFYVYEKVWWWWSTLSNGVDNPHDLHPSYDFKSYNDALRFLDSKVSGTKVFDSNLNVLK